MPRKIFPNASKGTTSRPSAQRGFAKVINIQRKISKNNPMNKNIKQQAITKNFITRA